MTMIISIKLLGVQGHSTEGPGALHNNLEGY